MLEDNNILIVKVYLQTAPINYNQWIWASTNQWRSSCEGSLETGIPSKFKTS